MPLRNNVNRACHAHPSPALSFSVLAMLQGARAYRVHICAKRVLRVLHSELEWLASTSWKETIIVPAAVAMDSSAWLQTDDEARHGPASGNSQDAEQIARTCLEQYDRLGGRGAKPVVRSDGRHEWTVLAAVVLRRDGGGLFGPTYTCTSLATGVKAQPLSNLSSHGDVLHDCHAEVLARRSARAWLLQRLLDEVRSNGSDGSSRPQDAVFRQSANNDCPYELAPNVSLHLYCSTLACGDLSSARMLAQRARNDGVEAPSDPEAQSIAPLATLPLLISTLRGRSRLERAGTHLRTKPGRPDAPVSVSMSCSDKIALWSIVGFQGALLSLWIAPLFFRSYVIGDETNGGGTSRASGVEAYNKILQAKAGENSRDVHTPQIHMVNIPFRDSRERVQARLLAARPDAVVTGPSDELDIVPAAGCASYGPRWA